MKGKHRITTANINPHYECDIVFDIQKRFPISNEQYDTVISLNVLEHIFKFENVFLEVHRVLKKDGLFVFAVPFMFQIHGSPDDFFRYTKSAIINLLIEKKFRNIEIKELGYGFFSLIAQIICGVVPTFYLKKTVNKSCCSIDKLLLRISNKYKELSMRIPLGYIVNAKK